MASSILLRNQLFTGEVDGHTISLFLEEAESGLHPVAKAIRQGSGRRLFERLMQAMVEQPHDVITSMRRNLDRPATLFACLPADEMFELFAAIEEVDPGLLQAAVEQAPGAIRVVANERFSFLGAMHKLCTLLTFCQRSPKHQPSM